MKTKTVKAYALIHPITGKMQMRGEAPGGENIPILWRSWNRAYWYSRGWWGTRAKIRNARVVSVEIKVIK